MELRMAQGDDLAPLKAMYGALVRHMDASGLRIWDQVYPCEFLAADIRRRALYVLTEGAALLAAFALCPSHSGAGSVRWNSPGGGALYLDRLGVHPGHLRRGLGGAALEQAAMQAQGLGADTLRLFVVDTNAPAIALYRKCGFSQAEGSYDERIDDDLVLRQFGFERTTAP